MAVVHALITCSSASGANGDAMVSVVVKPPCGDVSLSCQSLDIHELLRRRQGIVLASHLNDLFTSVPDELMYGQFKVIKVVRWHTPQCVM